jgi:hypothetical protein
LPGRSPSPDLNMPSDAGQVLQDKCGSRFNCANDLPGEQVAAVAPEARLPETTTNQPCWVTELIGERNKDGCTQDDRLPASLLDSQLAGHELHPLLGSLEQCSKATH